MAQQLQLEIDELKRFRLFQNLDLSELRHLAEILEPVENRSGKFLFREGSDGTDLYFIARGKLKVCRADKEGKEVTLALCGPGDIIGEIALLTNSLRTADVISLCDAQLWRCTRAHLEAHCSQFPKLSYAIMTYMAHRIRVASSRITDLALYDVTMRVARVLLGMSVLTMKDGCEVNTIHEKPTHQVIASMVGASREAVTRALGVLVDEGHLEMDEERMWVHSLPAH